MKHILVWDIPIRLFHWILAGSFVVAFAIPNLFDDESAVFAVHMLLGGVMAFMVLLRIVWGFVGTRWARFTSFVANPKELVAYLGEAFAGRGKRYTGHNPGSSLAALLMFVFILGLAGTGIMMGNGGGEVFKELHEILAWSMVAVIGAHIVGIVAHTIRHRENIAMSMVDGRKEAAPSSAIPSASPVVGLVFLVLTGLWATSLISGYDAATGEVTLPLIGQTLQVGEGEGHDESGYDREEHDREEHDGEEH